MANASWHARSSLVLAWEPEESPRMPDVFSKSKRSEVMSRIRCRGNRSTELALIRILRQEGIVGWRRNSALSGRPDFVFPSRRVAIFVDGCFWHACPEHCNSPQTNAAFWRAKLDANRARDTRVNRALSDAGWTVMRIWEHELRAAAAKRLTRRLHQYLRGQVPPVGVELLVGLESS
jgi:DNA mismatch endonuclease (patch repair protein)